MTLHVPVLPSEVLDGLAPVPGAILVDGTLGAGGHTRLLAAAVAPGGKVIALDRDPAALEAAQEWADPLGVERVWANFCDLPEVLRKLQIDRVDGVLLDLGWSSDQLADPSRGFSFALDGPLDLRYDPTRGEPASRLIQRLSEQHLADLIYAYGEERYSRRVARRIVEQRHQQSIDSTRQLAELVRSCVPRSPVERIDPATRTFQALRIAVNDELKSLEIALRRIPECLKPGARMAVISFHSLEDRRVKEAFRDDMRLQLVSRKPIVATDEEIARNPRARSAKLRVAARR